MSIPIQTRRSERISKYYDELATQYGKDVKSCDYRSQWSFRERQHAVMQSVEDIKDQHILDVGCGNGLFSASLGQQNNVTGLDVSEIMLSMAKEYLNPVRACGECLPFRDGAFDVTLANGVLEDILEARPFLKELLRVTRSRGKLIFSAINKTSIIHQTLRRFSGYEGMCFHSLEDILSNLKEEPSLNIKIKWMWFPLPLLSPANPLTNFLSPLATFWIIECTKRSPLNNE